MRRADRHFQLLERLADGRRHRAVDLAHDLGVSLRTIYRDMEWLSALGSPLVGTPGSGYRMGNGTRLPPMTLSEEELEALNLGIAIVGETPDPALKAAARSLGEKLDAALGEIAPGDPESAAQAISPFADAARGFSHMATLRAAIRGRQKLLLNCRALDGTLSERIVRPLRLRYWGRIWALTVWCEGDGAHRVLRTDLIETATPLPQLFLDEPGKTLADADNS